MSLTVRPVSADDVGFLWEMLFRASWSHLDEGSTVAGLAVRADLAYYVEGWGRVGAHGVVAVDDGVPVGAAWLRLLVGPQKQASHSWPTTCPSSPSPWPPATRAGVSARCCSVR